MVPDIQRRLLDVGFTLGSRRYVLSSYTSGSQHVDTAIKLTSTNVYVSYLHSPHQGCQ